MPASLPDHFESLLPELQAGLGKLGIELSPAQQHRCLQHIALLEQWNRSFNLTAITDPRQMLVLHVLDSLAITPWIIGERIIDIGAGAGFPGLPLAIACPGKQFTLLDGRGKKTRFVDAAIRKCQIDNAVSVHSRVEHFRPDDKFDTLVARAFGDLTDIHDLGHHLLRPGGRIVAMKGEFPRDELAALEQVPDVHAQAEAVEVPFLNANRHIVTLTTPD